ncbi:hypothetical protein VCHA51O444_10086 [Vibrio chagasii]|nr:hypothetical protein VCHA51O444_10086 [Vibrio chagasii]
MIPLAFLKGYLFRSESHNFMDGPVTRKKLLADSFDVFIRATF